jgi:hypothetical protein
VCPGSAPGRRRVRSDSSEPSLPIACPGGITWQDDPVPDLGRRNGGAPDRRRRPYRLPTERDPKAVAPRPPRRLGDVGSVRRHYPHALLPATGTGSRAARSRTGKGPHSVADKHEHDPQRPPGDSDGREGSAVTIKSLNKLNGVSVWVLYPRDKEPAEPNRGSGQARYAEGGKGPVRLGGVLSPQGDGRSLAGCNRV